jgi:DNA ligase-1
MLAHDYRKQGHRIKFPCHLSKKLDGVRCLALIDVKGNNVRLVSRGGKDYPIHYVLKAKLLSIGINTGHTLLDGELYIHGMPLQDIVSAAKKPNTNTPNLEFVIFDLPCEETPWAERYEKLIKLHEDTGHKIVVNFTAHSAEDVLEWHTVLTENGYEGVMLRNYDAKYKFGKRDGGLQKFKTFMDAEYLVVNVELDKNDEPVWHVEQFGNSAVAFKVKMMGSNAERVQMWQDRDKIIGEYMTVKYFTLTNDGIPQFPVGIAIRNYE